MVVRRNKIAPVQMNFLALFLPTFPLVMYRAITKGSKGCVAFYAGPQQMLLSLLATVLYVASFVATLFIVAP